MAKIYSDRFNRTDLEFHPYVEDPEVSDDIQQSLARLLAWDSANGQWRRLAVDPNGNLNIIVAQNKASSGINTAVSVSTTATLLANVNTSRKSIVIYNNGPETVFLGYDTNVSFSTGIPLTSGSAYSDDTYLGSYFGITSSGTSDVRIGEVY